MDQPKISFVASSIRPHLWKNMYDSLLQNTESWEMIMVGPNDGPSPGERFTFIKSNVKPAQCYEIGFRRAKGILTSWTADDAIYSPQAVDIVYRASLMHDQKTVFAFRTIEDGRDITEIHRFIGKNVDSPRMALFGTLNTELFRKLGGYDKHFLCGQSENDVVMRVLEIGGKVEVVGASAIVSHEKAHYQGTVFRTKFYHYDRKVLESAWMEDGKVLRTRKYPVEPFDETEILTISQSEKGQWL